MLTVLTRDRAVLRVHLVGCQLLLSLIHEVTTGNPSPLQS